MDFQGYRALIGSRLTRLSNSGPCLRAWGSTDLGHPLESWAALRAVWTVAVCRVQWILESLINRSLAKPEKGLVIQDP